MTAPADKGKKAKTDADAGEENEQIDGALVLSIEKLQEIQDELEKVSLYSSPRSVFVRPERLGVTGPLD
jgi:template-activating factor I